MNIIEATNDYEAWLAQRTTLVSADLRAKHKAMREGVFPFLRSTFYRWAQTWPDLCPALTNAPIVLAVGDLHVENFGTWRDAEGRLIWGVNDFDEAAWMPYTNDLVRLAVSAAFAVTEGSIQLSLSDVCEAILDGYREGLKAGGEPFVLAEKNEWLRALGESAARDPALFWEKMNALPSVEKDVPLSAREGMEHLLPEAGLAYRVVHRTAGLGSLGHQRFVAVADWRGGKSAREAKALVPSSVLWAARSKAPVEILYQAILSRSVRALDPFVELRGQWIVRRLAPDCTRVELTGLPQVRDENRLLHDMGWETANIHLGSREQVKAVRADLKDRSRHWLETAVQTMRHAVTRDWHSYQKA